VQRIPGKVELVLREKGNLPSSRKENNAQANRGSKRRPRLSGCEWGSWRRIEKGENGI